MIEILKALDLSLFVFLNSLNIKSMNGIMIFASGYLVWVPFLFYVISQSKKQQGSQLTLFFIFFLFLAIIASDASSSYIIKNLFHRLRPCRDEDVKPLIYYFGQRCGGKFGFVSSHAANSFAIATFSISVLSFKKINHLIWILPFFVSYSRIYLGVHYPGDIIGGALIGIIWGWVLAFVFRDHIKGLNGRVSKTFS